MGSNQQRRREVHYSGHVQGVGFRYTTQQVAGNFDVTGFVQNLSDGRVFLVVEAEAGELDLFLRDIHARLGSYIQNSTESKSAASGEFSGFSIRHGY